MGELFKSLGDFLLTFLVVSTALMFIKNKRIRNTLAAVVGVLGLFWFLVVLILSVGAGGFLVAAVALLVCLCLLIFLIHYGSRAFSKHTNPPKF